jgi:hypothetical protein
MFAISILYRQSWLSVRRKLLRIDKFSVTALAPELWVVRDPDRRVTSSGEGRWVTGRVPAYSPLYRLVYRLR